MLFPLLVGVSAGVAIQRYILADEENRIHEIFDGFDRYYNKGMLMGVQELIYKMSQTEKVIELMGYTKALKEKFEGSSIAALRHDADQLVHRLIQPVQ